MKKVRIDGNVMFISFPYDPKTIAQVKTLSGRRWDQGQKMWTAPYCLESVEKLTAWGFSVPAQVKKAGRPSAIKINGIKRPLKPYQVLGVEHIEAADGRTILGDQQGLGKTATKLAWLQYRPDVRPAVVVCPSNAKWGYYHEAKYIVPNDRVSVISGEWRQGNVLEEADIHIINYDILFYNEPCPECKGKKKVKKGADLKKCPACKGRGVATHLRPDIKKIDPQAILIDECQYLQEMTSSRTQAVYQLAEKVPHVIGSSGTPIKHRPKNFYPMLHLVRPDIFPAFFPFAIKYCGAKKGFFGWDFGGASNQEEFHDVLTKHKVLLRRTKAEVLPDLPKMTRTTVYLEFSAKEMKEYRYADRDFLSWLEDKDPASLTSAQRAEALVRINKLKQLVVRLKMKKCLQWVEDFLDGEEKLIMFAHHKETISELKQAFKPESMVVVDGSCTDIQKRDAETRFQACAKCGVKKDKHDIDPGACREYRHNDTRVFLGTLAAKEALTLTAAQDVCFLEFWDSPKDHEQAEERCYGRISDPHGATAWYLVARDTIEEDILASQEEKRQVIDAIIDGKDCTMEAGMAQLLQSIKRRNI